MREIHCTGGTAGPCGPSSSILAYSLTGSASPLCPGSPTETDMSESSPKALLNPPKTPADLPSPGGLASTLGFLLAKPAASLRDYYLLAYSLASAILLVSA